MQNYFYLLLFPIFMQAQEEATSAIVYPKGNWYFGAEVGTNTTVSNEFKHDIHFQAGLTVEYYFAKQWTVFGKITYYHTEVAYNRPPDFLSNGARPYQELYFNGKVISIPVAVKWEFRIFKNLKGFLSAGIGYNVETEGEYFIPGNPNPDVSMFPTSYVSFTSGGGLNYFLSDKCAIYLSSEGNVGGNKGRYDNFFFGSNYIGAQNSMVNLGVKYKFKDKKD